MFLIRAALRCRRNCDAAARMLQSRSFGKSFSGAWQRPGRASGIFAENESGKVFGSTRTCGTLRFDFVRVKKACLLYTSYSADDLLCADLGVRRFIKKQ